MTKRISAKHGRIMETICAFANTDGGVVAIGIGDAKDMKPGVKPESRLYGVEENAEGFDDLRRQVINRFAPAISRLRWLRLSCTLNNGQAGHVVMLWVEKSEQVHSIVGNGTWTRMDTSNRELTATEISDLSYQRGTRPQTPRALKHAQGIGFEQSHRHRHWTIEAHVSVFASRRYGIAEDHPNRWSHGVERRRYSGVVAVVDTHCPIVPRSPRPSSSQRQRSSSDHR